MMEAIFLDRDGVINRKPPDGEYISAAADLHFLPGALEAIATLSTHYSVFIVTNQRGVARGLMSSEDLDLVHARLRENVSRRGGRIRKIYVCTHDHHEECVCRKPRPGMLIAASRDYGIDLSASWMVGDSQSDMLAGREAGCRTALIKNRDSHSVSPDPDLIGASLAEIAQHILGLRVGAVTTT